MKRDHKKHIRNFYQQEGRIPSFSEMMKIFGYKSKTSISRLVESLEAEGFLRRSGKRDFVPGDTFKTLRLLGTVQAGLPQDVEGAEVGDSIDLDAWMVDDQDKTYLLEVTGDSMINAGIQEGDYVLVKHQAVYKPEDIVIAEVDEQWTLKRLKAKHGKYYLKAENDNYDDIYPYHELHIHGVVQGVIRKY